MHTILLNDRLAILPEPNPCCPFWSMLSSWDKRVTKWDSSSVFMRFCYKQVFFRHFKALEIGKLLNMSRTRDHEDQPQMVRRTVSFQHFNHCNFGVGFFNQLNNYSFLQITINDSPVTYFVEEMVINLEGHLAQFDAVSGSQLHNRNLKHKLICTR